MFRVKNFCCGYSLKTGTLLITFFNSILQVINITLRTYLLLTDQEVKISQQLDILVWYWVKTTLNTGPTVLGFLSAYKGILKHVYGYLPYQVYDILMDIVQMIILYFSIDKIPKATSPLLNSHYHQLVEGIREISRREYVNWRILTLEDVVFEEIFHSIALVLQLYFFIVARSYYLRLKEEVQDQDQNVE